MAMMNLSETTIPKLYSKGLYDDKDFDLGPHTVEVVATTYFNATSYVLKDTKNKDYPVAFIYDGVNMEFYAGAVIRYIPNETEGVAGHWNYIWTFDQNDIPDNARKLRISDVAYHQYFEQEAHNYHFGFRSAASTTELGVYFMKTMSQWLQDNAKADEEIGVKLDGVFQARAIVEDNEVIKSIELIGETKAIIKDDEDVK